jgi:hypothetical protein
MVGVSTGLSPHGYVSPRCYGAAPAVPTWNYVAAHVHGRARVLRDKARLVELVDTLSRRYEGDGERQQAGVELHPIPPVVADAGPRLPLRALAHRLPPYRRRGDAAADPSNLVEGSSSSSSSGTGSIERKETIALRVAAVVTQILPNGNLVGAGSQEVRVNSENRALQVAGVVRPQDIRSTNEIPHDRLAEARIQYGGRGQITDVQRPRWGQELFDVIFPF